MWLALLPSKMLDIAKVFFYIKLKNSLKQYTAPSVLQITPFVAMLCAELGDTG